MKNVVLSDLRNSNYTLSGTFYGIKKTFSVVEQRHAKVGHYAHFSAKMYGKIRENRPKIAFFSLKKAFNLAPDHFQNPIFGQIVSLYGLYKRYLGFCLILNFWSIFGVRPMKKGLFFHKFPIFSCSGPQI